MLAYIGDGPIVGAPGCARSRKTNIVDWILPRLLVGDRLTRKDIVALGHGGLLQDISERGMPRDLGEADDNQNPDSEPLTEVTSTGG
jgi:molybdopterin biosynthesis enzyme